MVEKKILQPLLPEFELATFQPWVWCFTNKLLWLPGPVCSMLSELHMGKEHLTSWSGTGWNKIWGGGGGVGRGDYSRTTSTKTNHFSYKVWTVPFDSIIYQNSCFFGLYTGDFFSQPWYPLWLARLKTPSNQLTKPFENQFTQDTASCIPSSLSSWSISLCC